MTPSTTSQASHLTRTMTRTMTRTARGPERFRTIEPRGAEPRWRSALSLGVLLAVILGVPALMLWLAGPPPVPTDLDLTVLTRAVSAQALLGLLVWVVWLAWLQFTACTVVEVVSAVRVSGLPAHVPLAGGMQGLVRRLVTSALVLGAVVTPVATAAPTAEMTATPVTAVQVQAGQDTNAAEDEPSTSLAPAGDQAGQTGADAASDPATTQSQTDVRYMLGDVELPADVGATLVGQKVYVVQPPAGRYHDNLWDIAERTLGDGRSYQQIYDLNVGRTQPDGRSLELARLIQPGWYLVVPESAQGADRVVAVPVDPTDAATHPAADPGQTQGSTQTSQAGGPVAASVTSSVPDVTPAQVPALGSLLAASLVALLARRRRQGAGGSPDDDALELDRLLRVGADPQRSRRVHAILSQLPEGARAAQPYAMVIDDDAGRLLLSVPTPVAPAPWTVKDDGLTWVLASGDEPARTGGAPDLPGTLPGTLPGMVTIGRDEHGADVLINLAAADGDVVVGGEPTMAAELIAALALELGTNPWSSRATVTGIGLPTALRRVVGERLHLTDEADISPSLLTSAGNSGNSGDTGDTENTVLGGLHPGRNPAFLLASGAQGPMDATRGLNMPVVRTGSAAGARWRIDVDASGTARIEPLGVTVTATRATGTELDGMVSLLATPAPPPPGSDGRPPVPDPPTPPLTTAALRAARIRIRVLGPALVETDRPVEDERRDLLTEAAICIALHPGGIRPAVLGAMLWPLGATGDVVESALTRLRTWLGEDPLGLPVLRETEDGRLHLGPGVVLDWDVMRSLLAASRTADEESEGDLLLEALRLVRGRVGQGTPSGRYSWLARVRTARQADSLVTDAAHRAVQIFKDTDPDGAALAVDTGLMVVDLDQRLWRDRFRLASAQGRSELLGAVTALLDAAGADDLTQVDPATAALVEDLAPGASARRVPA